MFINIYTGIRKEKVPKSVFKKNWVDILVAVGPNPNSVPAKAHIFTKPPFQSP